MTALITKGADVGELVARKDRDDLTAWFNVYMSVEIEPGSNTYRAKLGDIQWFLRFFYETTSGYECDQWTRSLSKSFLTWIQKQKSERTGGSQHLPSHHRYGQTCRQMDSPSKAFPCRFFRFRT